MHGCCIYYARASQNIGLSQNREFRQPYIFLCCMDNIKHNCNIKTGKDAPRPVLYFAFIFMSTPLMDLTKVRKPDFVNKTFFFCDFEFEDTSNNICKRKNTYKCMDRCLYSISLLPEFPGLLAYTHLCAFLA